MQRTYNRYDRQRCYDNQLIRVQRLTNLTTVYYNGTKDEWGEISINGTDSGNSYLTNASIICTDGTYTY